MKKSALLAVLLCRFLAGFTQERINTDVLVIGGGAGGTAAGIESARSGAVTCIVETTPWLGGMLSAAGVTATDGNNKLYSGIWQEFREALYKHYGTRNLMTGWVSNTQFEPHVADSIFKVFAGKEKFLTVKYGYSFANVIKKGNKVVGAIFKNNAGKTLTVYAAITIDGTELGDVLAKAGAKYDVGMEADSITHEGVGITQNDNIVQDLTYAAVLKDYGARDMTIAEPKGYDPHEFDGACTSYYHDTTIEAPTVDAAKMLDYGKLPNGKYMINWPKRGNDAYMNVIEMNDAQRAAAFEKAKQVTFRFIYFIQHQLGFNNLGLADDEFSTQDRLPYIPYHREGRRVQGLVRMTMKNISEPFTYGDALYRTGISVGDYPIDHHHKKNPSAPQHLYFYPIPSFNVPLGSLIPKDVQGLVVAEKGISVSNIVNGTTRLQPCVLLTGQAAGALAAISVLQKKQPAQVKVRDVQDHLLKRKAYLMPYIDVMPADSAFTAIQRVGATGILKGTGVPYHWANQTWFYPDSTITENNFLQGLAAFDKQFRNQKGSDDVLTVKKALLLVYAICPQPAKQSSAEAFAANVRRDLAIKYPVLQNDNAALSRRVLSVLLDKYADVFHAKNVNWKGEFITSQK